MKTADTSSRMTLRVSAVLLIIFLTSQFLVAQTWYNTSWSYRSPVTVSNPGTITLTDLQVNIKLNASNFAFNNSNNDGSDIRLTDSDGVTTIPFWIESWVPGSTASIWVKIPSIPATGTTLFVYYGNVGATSLSSGTGTFEFFDDFETWSVTPHPSVWQDLSSSAPIPTPSADLTISVYDNKLYSFGGYGPSHEFLNTVYEYDPTMNVWTGKTPMPTIRWGMVSVEFNGQIYVFGGELPNEAGSNANEIYHPVTNTWTTGLNQMPSEIANQGLMGVLYGDKIHLFYGSYHYEYDPVDDTYTQKTDVPNPRSWATCAVVGSSIYLIGGWNLTVGVGGGTNTIQVLNPVADTWDLTKMPMPISRYGATRENPVIGGKIYVTHGWNFTGYFFTCNYVYDPVVDTWELKGSANHPRDGVACGIINNKLYVVGGRDRDFNFGGVQSAGRNYNEVYDPLLDTWVPQADPYGWTTSGSNYAFTDATAAYPGSYEGNHGLVIRQPMDGSQLGYCPSLSSPPLNGYVGFRTAGIINDFGISYALDFDWNITTLGGISEGFPIYPQGVIRLYTNCDFEGNLLFIEDNNEPIVKWIDGQRYRLQNSSWDSWHKITAVSDGANSIVVFDGNQYLSLFMRSWAGTGNIRFGVISTTQYLDNVRVRKWTGSNPVTVVGIEQNGTLNHWTGTSSSNWDTPGNWSSGSVPTLSSNIAIFNASFFPIITSSQSVSCNNLTIEPTARLTIDPGGILSVGGVLTINSVGSINSGSMVVNGTLTAGSVTYNRYMPIGAAWHYVSTPVSLSADPAGSFWAWDEVAGDWSASTIARPLSGIGYTLRTDGNEVAFTGSLVASDLPPIVATSPYSDPFDGSDYSGRNMVSGRGYGGGGWNLLGNPYTSAMNVSVFIDANYNSNWNLSNFDPNYVALYLYNGSSYQYVTKNEMGWQLEWPNGDPLNATHIQVGQGFFVLAMNDQVTFNFSRSMQGHNTNVSLLKSAKVKYRWPGLRLQAKYGETETLTTIVFKDDMTVGLDPGYDVGLMSSGSDFELYTALVEDNGINFTLQALPENGSVKNVIPVGVDFEKGGQIIFSADIEPLRNYKFWLEDRLTGILTDLSANSYTVTLPPKTYGTGRFFVYVAAGRSIQPRTNHTNLLEIRIWASKNKQISIQGPVSEKAICEVFDTWGHKIFEAMLSDGDLNTFMVPSVINGVYLVKVTDGMKVVSQKVVLL